MEQKIFDKYYKRLRKEGILKAVVIGLSVGFGVLFGVSLLSWIFGFDGGLWLGLGLMVAAGVATALPLYFIKFVPTSAAIARRVDALGFEERMVTMLELENDNSYIAMRQREDAREQLRLSGNGKQLKVILPKICSILLAANAVPAIPMATIIELAALDIIPSGVDVVSDSRYDYVAVTYFAEDGGYIDSEDYADQLIERGADAVPVMAVAEDGWVFMGWDDGVTSPYREDLHVTDDLFVTALFEEIPDGDAPDGDAPGGDGEGGNDEGDLDPDEPGTEADGDSQKGTGEGEASGGDGEPDGEGTGSQGGGDDEGGKGQGNGAGGKYNPSNQIIDGNTYYGDELANYIEQLKEALESNDELTEEDKAFIEKYFAGL